VTDLHPSLWVDLVGLPFRSGGRGPDAYDCYGVLLKVFARRGIGRPPLDTTVDDSEIARMVALALGTHWSRIEAPEPGCALLFRDRGVVRHVGIYIGSDRFLHATEAKRQVLVERLSAVRSYLPLLGAFQPSHATA